MNCKCKILILKFICPCKGQTQALFHLNNNNFCFWHASPFCKAFSKRYGQYVLVGQIELVSPPVKKKHWPILHICSWMKIISFITKTRRYGPLCGPISSSCGGLRPSFKAFFCPSVKKSKNLSSNFWSFKKCPKS